MKNTGKKALLCNPIGKVGFNDNVTFVIENPEPPERYGINIDAGGKFVVNSSLRSTTKW